MSYRKSAITIGVILLSIVAGKTLGTVFVHTAPPTTVTSPAFTALTVNPPRELRIPKLGIDAQVESVGQDALGAMDVPKNPDKVAWYQLGAKPGETGNAVIAGHLDWTKGPAIFYHLDQLEAGDTLTITDTENKQQQFVVTSKVSYPFDQFPLEQVFGASADIHLNLITCAGRFNRTTKNYSNRIVVYTKLAEK